MALALMPRSLWEKAGTVCIVVLYVEVVQERLDHANISLTLDTHSHVSPTMKKSAAQFFGDALQI